MDKERERDILEGNGFFIKEPQSLKKDLESIDSIMSPKFGDASGDANLFANKYKCLCGKITSRVNQGVICDVCHTPVQYVDDDFNRFGWICLEKEYLIHPNLLKSIQAFMTPKKFDNIIKPEDEKNEDGFSIKKEKPKDEEYFGIGLIAFREKFDEIMEYYLVRSPNKREMYDHIMKNKDKIFIQSIPVYTSLLRPARVDGENFVFESTNATYNMMAKLAYSLNRDNLDLFRKKKTRKLLLYDLQQKYIELYTEIENILAKKKGVIRSQFGGRYNFTSRAVIVPEPKLRIDEIKLPYAALVECLQQTIVNILHKLYNVTYSEAWDIWYKSQLEVSERVVTIINNIISNYDRGIPFIINRN